MIRHVFFLGRRGKGWVADPKGVILWFFGLKIRNVVSSGRNKNIVVFIGKPGVHTVIILPFFFMWMFILKLKKDCKK